MFKSYLKTAFRNINRKKLNSFIIVLGLAVGFSAFTLIMLWIKNQFSYDIYNKKASRIYRVTTSVNFATNNYKFALSAAPLAAALQKLPEVENTVRLTVPAKNVIVQYKNKIFNENEFVYTDSIFFRIFTLPLIEGNPYTALSKPYSLVIPESIAKKYFGYEDPLGKLLSVNIYNHKHDYLITGVMKDIPRNSQFHIKFLSSFSTIVAENPKVILSWGRLSYYTYVLLTKSNLINSLNKELPGIVKQYMGAKYVKNWILDTQKLTSIHLHSHHLNEMEPNGNIRSVYLFGAAGVLIFLLAIINFITLSTSQSADRSGEIGVRKTLGAGRLNLFIQFSVEAVILIATTLIISISLTELSLPFFNELINQSLKLTFNNSSVIIITGAFLILIAGSYPAFYFSSFQPVKVLSKAAVIKPGGILIRKALIVIQFFMAIALIAFTLLVNKQLNYIMNKNLGFNDDHVIIIPMEHQAIQKKYSVIKNEFGRLKDVESMSASDGVPGNADFSYHLVYKGKNLFEIRGLAVDYNFLNTMDVKLLSGRNFSRVISSDLTSSIIVNNAAAEKLRTMHLMNKNFELPLFGIDRKNVGVIGVINNFHYQLLYYPVGPMAIYLNPQTLRFVEVRISPDNISNTIKKLKQKWAEILPDYPFEFSFLRDDLNQKYSADKKLGSIFNIFSVLSILIGCLGLFGLSSYTAEKRTKEIGIRKVLGASAGNIVLIIIKDFLRLIVFAGIISVPVSYFFIYKWLNEFAYKANITPWIFILPCMFAIVTAFLTVSFKAIKAATANPVKSLRYE